MLSPIHYLNRCQTIFLFFKVFVMVEKIELKIREKIILFSVYEDLVQEDSAPR